MNINILIEDNQQSIADLLVFSDLELDQKIRECKLNENRGRVVSSEELFYEVWGDKYFTNSNNTIMVHIRHLSEKMHDSTERPKYIKTVWGVGYKIEK